LFPQKRSLADCSSVTVLILYVLCGAPDSTHGSFQDEEFDEEDDDEDEEEEDDDEEDEEDEPPMKGGKGKGGNKRGKGGR
jgi:major membrane immunogen (membrane-anchored lipoprotein)